MKTGCDEISAERARQISKGWSLEHDKEHRQGEIVEAAIDCLSSYRNGVGGFHPTPVDDRWGLGRKHNHKPLKLLKIAGALVAAEIDRISNTSGNEAKIPLRGHLNWALKQLERLVEVHEDGTARHRQSRTEIAGFALRFEKAKQALAHAEKLTNPQ